jgi:hypothetical protein
LKEFISFLRAFGPHSGDLSGKTGPASLGIDMVFVISQPKNPNLSKPHYFLSNFQMPFMSKE